MGQCSSFVLMCQELAGTLLAAAENSARGSRMLARIVRILRRRSPVELAVMLTDRLVRPLGISLISFTRYGPIPAVGGDTAREKFDGIARGNLWGSSESLSGPGSELARSEPYRAELTKLLRQGRFQSMFDAPCGDLNWMRLVLDQVDIDYAGGDISPSIIELNRSRFPGRAFYSLRHHPRRFPRGRCVALPGLPVPFVVCGYPGGPSKTSRARAFPMH